MQIKILKNFSIVAAVIFFLNFTIYFTAESSPPYNVLKVGYVVDTSFLNEDRPGHIVGYGYEYMELLENYMPCQFEYVVFDDWTDLLDKLNSGEIDIIPNLPGDHKWLVNAKSTDHVVGRFPMELVIKPEQMKPQIKLARVRTNYDTPGLDEVARQEGFQYTLVDYKTYQDILKAYNSGEVDGYVDAMLFYNKDKPTYAVFDRQNYRLSVRADREELLNRLNWAMDQLLMDQSNIRDTLKRKYFLNEGFPLLLNSNEKNFLAEKKKLRTAILLYQKPRIYRDESGNLTGLMPEIIKRISKDLNVEIELVETKSYEEARNLMVNGEIDFIMDAICDFNWAEEYNMKPTQNYFQIDYVPVTRADYLLDSHENSKIACVSNMLFTMSFIEPNFKKENIIYFSTFEDCLKAVDDGRADVVYVNRDAVYSLIESTGTYDLEVGPVSVYNQLVGLGTRLNGDLRLWHILNKEINHIDVSWVRDTLNKHQQFDKPFNLQKFFYHNPLKILFLVALLIFGIGAFIYKRSMDKKNFEMIQRIAYTDFRYELPNVHWLEMKVPPKFEELKEIDPNLKTFFVVFSMMSNAVMTENSGHGIIDKQFKSLAKNLEEDETAIFTSAGIDVGHLVCFCKSESVEKLSEWAKEVIKKYSYVDTAANAKIVVHMRAGISSYNENLHVQQAIGRAVTACHKGSSGEVKIFDDKLEEYLTSQHDIESRMKDALKNDEFKAWYQPKYDIKTRKIIGAEALVRWISPEVGFMPPGKFIPLFEQNGFVIQVDYYILEKTFQFQKSRLEAGKEVVPISVNQSRLHMTEDGYIDKMRAIVEKYNLPPGLIELEITETMFEDLDAKSSRQNAENIIRQLKQMGFLISVDDFGAGYSSFSLLGNLTMDIMKIDRSVLTGADKSQRMKKILGNVIKLGHSLDMSVICEGIETRDEEKLLLELGCHYGQGYFNAKPMPVDDFVNFFEKRNAEVAAGTFSLAD